jgi:hypothetical protein
MSGEALAEASEEGDGEEQSDEDCEDCERERVEAGEVLEVQRGCEGCAEETALDEAEAVVDEGLRRAPGGEAVEAFEERDGEDERAEEQGEAVLCCPIDGVVQGCSCRWSFAGFDDTRAMKPLFFVAVAGELGEAEQQRERATGEAAHGDHEEEPAAVGVRASVGDAAADGVHQQGRDGSREEDAGAGFEESACVVLHSGREEWLVAGG